MEQENISVDEEKETFILSSNIHAEEGIPVSDEEDENALEFNQLEHNNLASAEAPNVPSTTVHVVDELSVATEISDYIKVNRINLGELDTSIDMWAICDAISAAHSGLPDSLLRAAFLLVLDGSYSYAQNNSWIRGHLDTLSRVWKREMMNEKCSNRPTKFVSSSADISSPKSASGECVADESVRQPTCLEKDGRDQQQLQHAHDVDGSGVAEKASTTSKSRRQRRHVAKRKRALAVMMGVGQMLQARRTLTTEGGQMDVDEDEYGNFSIGGTELTFESWGKLNTIQEADIVYSGEQQQPIQDQDSSVTRPQQQQNGCRVEEKAEDKMEKLRQSNSNANIVSTTTAGGEHQKRGGDNDSAATALLKGMAQRYPTVAEVEVPSLMPATADDRRLPPTTNAAAAAKFLPKKAQKVAKMERKQKRRAEKDEGELSSSDSEEPTSSDEEEDNDNDDFGSSADEAAAALQSRTLLVAARERRRMRRVDEQKQGASSAQNLQALLRKCFELRTRIVGKLSIGQKAMFRDCLSKSISGTLQQQSQQPQQHQLQQLIHSVAGKPAADASAEMVFP
uniref:Uncharacterized protein n=1 Tax=Globodera rostochiensis TaxID=31243 RepID=A0A914HBV7_GLORO